MKISKWLVLGFLALLLAPSVPGSSTSEPRLPNILVIMTDDQTLDDMQVLAKTRSHLAAKGTTFENSFASYPLCCPSRATFLTGQYPHNHGVVANSGPNGYPRLDETNTLAVWLEDAGYFTAHVGKYLNGYGVGLSPAVPPGWSRWFGLMDPTTYRYYDYTVSEDGIAVSYGSGEEDYQTDVLAAEAERILRSFEGKAQPLFLVVTPLAPHLESLRRNVTSPPRPAPRHEGAFAHERFPLKPSFNEANMADKPDFLRRRAPLGKAAVEDVVETYRARHASLLAVDDLVERLVHVLERSGDIHHTVILFTSDNGFFLGEHRLPKGKFLPYEESIRVPLIVRGGGFPAGRTAKQLVSNVDLAPTILELARATPRRELDGRSLVPLALDPSVGKNRTLLIEGARLNANSPAYSAVRDERWLYVEYDQGGRELYDLKRDPYQLRSRHNDRALASLRAGLATRLARLRDCSGEECL
ncbi:MAG TPA: sulfatase [Thermoanaerobaculia bacterium]|nr:sulfatase [Thermoanaerobaculia bacterium]